MQETTRPRASSRPNVRNWGSDLLEELAVLEDANWTTPALLDGFVSQMLARMIDEFELAVLAENDSLIPLAAKVVQDGGHRKFRLRHVRSRC